MTPRHRRLRLLRAILRARQTWSESSCSKDQATTTPPTRHGREAPRRSSPNTSSKGTPRLPRLTRSRSSWSGRRNSR
ncbi:hypothetical protein ACJX0J_038454, partial [Zea mays]